MALKLDVGSRSLLGSLDPEKTMHLIHLAVAHASQMSKLTDSSPTKEPLNKPSHRRMPVSSCLLLLDSGFCRNDDRVLYQHFPKGKVNSLPVGVGDHFVAGADLQIAFPRHRDWLLMAESERPANFCFAVIRQYFADFGERWHWPTLKDRQLLAAGSRHSRRSPLRPGSARPAPALPCCLPGRGFAR